MWLDGVAFLFLKFVVDVKASGLPCVLKFVGYGR